MTQLCTKCKKYKEPFILKAIVQEWEDTRRSLITEAIQEYAHE